MVLSNSISDTSLLEYAEIIRYGEKRVVKEAIQKPQKYGASPDRLSGGCTLLLRNYVAAHNMHFQIGVLKRPTNHYE